MITSSGTCKHVNGGYPSYCYNGNVNFQSICEGYCTSEASCVGYFYHASGDNCYLIPSNNSCPSTFILHSQTNLATTMNDLVAVSYSGYVCYGKKSGKLNET